MLVRPPTPHQDLPKNASLKAATDASRRIRPKITTSLSPRARDRLDSLSHRTNGNRSRALDQVLEDPHLMANAVLNAIEAGHELALSQEAHRKTALQLSHAIGALREARNKLRAQQRRLIRVSSRLSPDRRRAALDLEKALQVELAARLEELRGAGV